MNLRKPPIFQTVEVFGPYKNVISLNVQPLGMVHTFIRWHPSRQGYAVRMFDASGVEHQVTFAANYNDALKMSESRLTAG